MDSKDKKRKLEPTRRTPVWYDPEDEKSDSDGIARRRMKLQAKPGKLYRDRLIESFELAYGPTPAWARNSEEEVSSDDETAETSEVSKDKLGTRELRCIRVKDLNDSLRNEGAIIRSVDCHPSVPAALVAGSNNLINLYKVDAERSSHIKALTFNDFPLRHAQFSVDGDKIYVSSGLRPHFYSCDIHKGTYQRVKPNQITKNETIRLLRINPNGQDLAAVGHQGQIYILSVKTTELMHRISVNSEVKDASYSKDGSELFILACDGEVYRYKTDVYQCVEKFSSQGTFDGTAIAVSPNYIVCGSSSGYVTIYNNEVSQSADEIQPCVNKTPLGEIKNLRTSISSLHINNQEDLLAITSVDYNNGIKLAQLPSRTVFPRFPSITAQFGRCNSLAISPNSGYMIVGNNYGRALLFRLNKYEGY